MTGNDPLNFDDLEDQAALDAATVDGPSETPESERFPCNACSGTGQYMGRRVHQAKKHCFACGGKGWFKTSARDRQKKTAQRHVNKRAKLMDAQVAFNAENPGLASFLSKAGDWSEFARSLSEAIGKYGSLTDRQLNSARNMRAKCDERAAQKAEQAKNAPTVNLDPIREMFDTARANGKKKAAFLGEGLKITRAPDHGKNPGALYVTARATEQYFGKLLGTAYHGNERNTVQAPPLTKDGPERTLTVIEALLSIAGDPGGKARLFGQMTGICSCCGAELTNKISIDLGIGPICRQKWGL